MARIVDLSVTIENNMPAHKNMPRPVYLEWMTHESCKAYNQGVPGDPFTTPIEYVGMLKQPQVLKEIESGPYDVVEIAQFSQKVIYDRERGCLII